MKFPKLEDPLMCRVVLYGTIILVTFVPMIAFIILIPVIKIFGVLLMLAWCALSFFLLVKYFHYEMIGREKDNKKRFSTMQNGEVILDDEYVYAKWKDRGLCLYASVDEEKKNIEVDYIHKWSYPKEHVISKAARIELKVLIEEHLYGLGYSSVFEGFEG